MKIKTLIIAVSLSLVLWVLILAMCFGAPPAPQLTLWQPITVTVIPAADGRLVLIAPGGELYELRPIQPEPQPQPQPNPGPNPQPQPSPNRAVYLYLIHESGDNTPAFAAVKDAKAWRDEAANVGLKVAVLDKDPAIKALPNVVAKAKAVGLPAVVLVDQSGLATAEKCPSTVADMTALVRRVTK